MEIIVPSGKTPVHSFDLWGTLVIQELLGPRVLDAYAALMQGKETPEDIAAKMRNYDGVLRGDPAALAEKKKHVGAVEDPLWHAYARQEATVDFTGTLYTDALEAMTTIADAGEGLVILTTGNSPWVQQALRTFNPHVADRLRKIYSGDKTQAKTYEDTASDIAVHGGIMVSHTEDQLKGLTGLLQSDLKDKVRSIYVERLDLATPAEVAAKGVSAYTRDLRTITYVRR